MFKVFATLVAQQFQRMTPNGLYRSQASKDSLWETYLASFPPGTNPLFKERTEHDCQACKSFVRAVGGALAIVGDEIVSIWDIPDPDLPFHYREVAKAMANLARGAGIENEYLHTERSAGVAKNFQELAGGEIATWEHFHVTLPSTCVVTGDLIGTRLGETRSTKDVFLRSLAELTLESIDTTLELIGQNSLYRGQENRAALEAFRGLKAGYETTRPAKREMYAWKLVKTLPGSISKIRNTAIGSLLVDLSSGMDLDAAVRSFESKVAPANYKRPTAVVTHSMIEKARKDIEDLGLTSALERRYATVDDITANNILFLDRTVRKPGDVFDDIASTIPGKMPNLDRVEEVSIDKFLADILPKAGSVELFLENRHASNLVSLIAPADPTAKLMFKWPNAFSWSYAGDVADSMKERVKRAGGRVDGDFRSSLSWFNLDDLDLHLTEPGGYHISFRDKLSRSTGGQLDVDMNAGGPTSRSAVENIFYPKRALMKEGVYSLSVNNYNQRETIDVGFEVEIEFAGVVHSFSHPAAVRNGLTVEVAKFRYSHHAGIEILDSLPSTQASKPLWGVQTQAFHKVNVLMLSPNHWDDRPVGNKHFFFMLEGVRNEEKARGFYNEFLTESLAAHRKVFEMVGAKMRTEESARQLSGLGFSSTQRNDVLARVRGTFSRTVKINF